MADLVVRYLEADASPAFLGGDDLCNRQGFPRLTAAAIFLEALCVLAKANGTPRRERWRIWAMTIGVTAWAILRPYPAPPR